MKNLSLSRRQLFRAVPALALGGCLASRSTAGGEEISAAVSETEPLSGRWTKERINAWYTALPWICGCNYVPTYAINQIEMWQKLTFNPEIIDSELALAESIGFNTVRIFSHDLVWESERESFYANIRQFLDLCEKHRIRVIFNFFTNGGKAPSVMGKQPEPTPGLHNGDWRETPGIDRVMNQPQMWGTMERYVKETIEQFAGDRRILCWDIFNEPANIPVLDITGFVRLAFSWARQVNPSQPLTSAFLKTDLTPLNAFLADNCDFLSFHCYEKKEKFAEKIDALSIFGRPIICKEWLARCNGCTIEDCLPLMKERNVGAINWGLIPGKLQTHIPWKHLLDKHPEYKDVWFHDLFDENYQPYKESEIELIKQLTGVK